MKTRLLILFIMASGLLMAQTHTGKSLSVKEGKEGIYLFLSDRTLNPDNPFGILQVNIYRSIGKSDRFEPHGTLKAAQSQESFLSICGKDALKDLMKMKKLHSENEAWDYLQKHPELKHYGMFSLDVRFMEAMGTCYVDRDTKQIRPGSTVYYKAEYVRRSDPSKKTEITGAIVTGTKPDIAKPKVAKITESDSLIGLIWKSPADSSPDAMFGEVWKRKGNQGAFEKAGITMANMDSVTHIMMYSFLDKVTPFAQYTYYVIPVTQTFLSGPVSDTAFAISANFRQLAQSSIMKAKDTMSGIFLNWEPLKKTELYKGIVIERTKDPKVKYLPVDTIPAASSFYIDRRVLPNTSYYYQIRWLTIRNNMLSPAAFATGIHSAKKLFLEAPVLVAAKSVTGGIMVTWKKNKYPETAGYYLYRSDNENSVWTLASNLIKDSVFTDTTIHDGRKLYKYGVRAVNYDNMQSEFSNFGYSRLEIKVMPPSPLGLRCAADDQRVLLEWKDMGIGDRYIAGYKVYRKKIITGESETVENKIPDQLIREGFVRLTDLLLTSPVYTDYPKETSVSFLYAVISVDMFGNESNGSMIKITLKSSKALVPPAEIYLRRTSKGVEIRWDRNLQDAVIGYEIFRRGSSDKEPVRIGLVNAMITNYTDSGLIPGTLYFYSVGTKSESSSSGPGAEKGIRY